MELQTLHNFTQCEGDPLGFMMNVVRTYPTWFCQHMCIPFVGCCSPLLPSDIYDCREHFFFDNPVDLTFWFRIAIFWATLATVSINRGKVEPILMIMFLVLSGIVAQKSGLSPASRIPSNWLEFILYVIMESGAHFLFAVGMALPPKK
jgi:hypothetical protein